MPYNNNMKKVVSLVLIAALSLLMLAVAACGGVKPTRLTVTKDPDTIKVVQGQDPDFSGGLVEVEFSNGSVEEFPMSEMSVKGLKNDVLGTQTVALSYTKNGKTVSTTIDLTVVAPKVTALTLDTETVKKNYIEGTIFDKTGLVVTATYQTGNTAVIANYEISPATALTTDHTKVRITYRGVSVDIPVTVEAHAPSSLQLSSLPTKTAYFVSEPFSASGIAALVTYNDGTTEILGEGSLSFYHSDGITAFNGAARATDNEVKVVAHTKYGDIGTSFLLTVTAVAPTRLTVTMNGALSFFEDEDFAFDAAGEVVSVKVDYNDGSQVTLPGSTDYFDNDGVSLTLGQTSVTIWISGYSSVTASVPITVKTPQVVAIFLMDSPAKTDYEVGETVDLAGLRLRLTMEKADLGYRYIEYSEDCGITATTSVISDGQTSITVSYLGFTASYSITVAEAQA